MPVETVVTLCGNCGATLQPSRDAESIACGYCEQVTWLAPTRHDTRPIPAVQPPAPQGFSPGSSLHDALLRGPSGAAQGRAARLAEAQAGLGDPRVTAHALWPVGADASTTFGGSWSPSSMVGPPRVFPRYGDIGGAWAPAPRESPVEWVEARFSSPVPVRAVRVYETNQSGSTFALLDLTQGERILYAGPVQSFGGARVLEVAVEPPRVITCVRAYVVNRGWTEVDTIGLLSVAPLPVAMRAPVVARRGAAGCIVAAALVAVLVTMGAGVGVFLVARPPASAPAPRSSLPSARSSVAGAALVYGNAPLEALTARGVVWSSAVTDFSSEYSSARNAAQDAAGPPDVYPRGGDIDGAWASRATDGGEEWITVRFAAPVRAALVVWLETLHPGAIARVDDVSDGAAVVLWQGVAAAPGTVSAAGELALPAPRTISAVRIVLDTRRVAGWNEIDAVGLVPAP